MSAYHVPVMLREAIDALAVKPGGLYVDATLGGGGHSNEILLRGGRLVAFDLDGEAIEEAEARFGSQNQSGYTLVKSNFKQAKAVLKEKGIASIDGAIMDLGVSSHQIDDPARGFSYRFDGPLDMRMDGGGDGITAADVVNGYSEEALKKLLLAYGEERYAPRIAAEIVRRRRIAPIRTTGELSELVKAATPESYHRLGHPAKKTFQAIRLEVNGELTGLGQAIEDFAELLRSGGRLAVITFHSLEDRIVKQTMRLLCTDCICPKSFPVCVCGHKAVAKSAGRIRPSAEEVASNPRSASATLRIIEKL